MTLEFLISLTTLTIPLLFGYTFLLYLWKDPVPLGLRLGLSYGLGCGLITTWCFITGAIGLPMTNIWINGPLWAACLFFLTLHFKKVKKENPSYKTSNERLSILLLGVIFVYFFFILLRGASIPVYTWDSVASHTFNAKIIFHERSLTYLGNMPHNEYPLHIPLLQFWLNMTKGYWEDITVKLIFGNYLTALSVTVYFFLREFTRKNWALLGVVLLLASNFLSYHATICYRDLPMAYYSLSSFLLIVLWHHKKTNAPLLLAALFSGIGAMTKLEGLAYSGLHALLVLFIGLTSPSWSLKKKGMSFLSFAIPAFTLGGMYHVYHKLAVPHFVQHNPLAPDYANIRFELSWNIFARIGEVLYANFSDLFLTNNWNIIWLLSTVSILRLPTLSQRHKSTALLLLGALLLHFGMYLFLFSFTQYYHWIANTNAALSRSLLHIFPVVPVLIVILNAPAKMECEKTD